MVTRHPTAEHPPSRGTAVIGLYGGLTLVALLVSAWRGDENIYQLGSPTGVILAVSPLLGIVLGLLVVAGSRFAAARYAWGRELHRSFRDLLGPLTTRDMLVIAGASSIGEELFFRGALVPWIGVWPSAVLFALLHVAPGRRLLPWTASALVLGVVFGYTATWIGDLGAPIAAHFTINLLNLHFIVRVAPVVVDAPILSRR